MLQQTQMFDTAKCDCEKQIAVDPVLSQAMANLGFALHTTDQNFADLFGVQTTPMQVMPYIGVRQDEVTLFVLETDDDVTISTEPCAMHLKGRDVGVLVFSEEIWKTRFPQLPFAVGIVEAVAEHFLGYPLWDAFR